MDLISGLGSRVSGLGSRVSDLGPWTLDLGPGRDSIATRHKASYKNSQAGKKNNLLILSAKFYILRGMARILVLIIGIIWASLLLISWGGADNLSRPAAEIRLSRSS